jgi:hypothetical protein
MARLDRMLALMSGAELLVDGGIAAAYVTRD